MLLTPAKHHVKSDGAGVGEERQEDEIVYVETFHQDPRVVRHDAVLPNTSHSSAQPGVLWNTSKTKSVRPTDLFPKLRSITGVLISP